MERILEEEILNEFNNDNEIWPKEDKWHTYTQKNIQDFISSNQGLINDAGLIINAGSAGENYGISDQKTLHIDIAEHKIISKPQHLVSNLESISLQSNYADIIICVGSVINYSDASRIINELSRLLKVNGYLILEFENSNTLELLLSREFNANVTFRKTFYRYIESKIWYYSEDWIEKILNTSDIIVIKRLRWHIISALILGICKKGNFSSRFSCLDKFARKIPLVRRNSSNVIFLCKKID